MLQILIIFLIVFIIVYYLFFSKNTLKNSLKIEAYKNMKPLKGILKNVLKKRNNIKRVYFRI